MLIDARRLARGHVAAVIPIGALARGFGTDGAFYATEFETGGMNEGPTADPAGDVVRIGRHGHCTHLGVGKLFSPSGFAAGRHGAIYVSNCSIAAGMGPQLCPPAVRSSASGNGRHGTVPARPS